MTLALKSSAVWPAQHFHLVLGWAALVVSAAGCQHPPPGPVKTSSAPVVTVTVSTLDGATTTTLGEFTLSLEEARQPALRHKVLETVQQAKLPCYLAMSVATRVNEQKPIRTGGETQAILSLDATIGTLSRFVIRRRGENHCALIADTDSGDGMIYGTFPVMETGTAPLELIDFVLAQWQQEVEQQGKVSPQRWGWR